MSPAGATTVRFIQSLTNARRRPFEKQHNKARRDIFCNVKFYYRPLHGIVFVKKVKKANKTVSVRPTTTVPAIAST